jgi:hypothetical protein
LPLKIFTEILRIHQLGVLVVVHRPIQTNGVISECNVDPGPGRNCN